MAQTAMIIAQNQHRGVTEALQNKTVYMAVVQHVNVGSLAYHYQQH